MSKHISYPVLPISKEPWYIFGKKQNWETNEEIKKKEEEKRKKEEDERKKEEEEKRKKEEEERKKEEEDIRKKEEEEERRKDEEDKRKKEEDEKTEKERDKQITEENREDENEKKQREKEIEEFQDTVWSEMSQQGESLLTYSMDDITTSTPTAVQKSGIIFNIEIFLNYYKFFQVISHFWVILVLFIGSLHQITRSFQRLFSNFFILITEIWRLVPEIQKQL
jgi:hypothetical protein